MPRKSSKASVWSTKTISSATVSKATDQFVRTKASKASQVLRDPNASRKSKTIAGSSMSQLSEVKKGGVAYHITGTDADSTVVSTATSVHSIKETTGKYRKVLSRLAKK